MVVRPVVLMRKKPKLQYTSPIKLAPIAIAPRKRSESRCPSSAMSTSPSRGTDKPESIMGQAMAQMPVLL